MFDNKNENHTSSWVWNWCIWKNFWETIYQKFENCEKVESQISNLKKIIKFNEYLHLKYSIGISTKREYLKQIENQTKNFQFYSIKNQLNNGEKGKKLILKDKE